MNDRLALDVFIEHGPQTRATLGEHTGLSKPSVAELLDRLLAAELVEETGELGSGRPGPNARGYRVVRSAAYVAGIEVHAGLVRAAIADITGEVLGERSVQVDPAADPLGAARRLVAEVMADAGVEALHSAVIGTGGIVDPATGDPVYVWGQPEWHEGLAARLRSEWGHPVVFENEVNLRAVAEHRLGAARGEDSFVLLDLSQGVGLAVVLGGELHRGASGGAGEIGYLPVPGAPFGAFARHRESRPGGFQALAGGDAVVELGRSLGVVVEGGGDGGGDSAGVGGASPESAVVAAAVAAHHEEFLEALAHRVSVGAAAVCAVLDPGFMVLGGTVARAGGAEFADRVEREITRLSPLRPRVAVTALPENAMLTGALMTGLEAARDEVFGPAMRYAG